MCSQKQIEGRMDLGRLDDNTAKRIVRNYHRGFAPLHDYILAIEYYTEKNPDSTMIDLEKWSKEGTC